MNILILNGSPRKEQSNSLKLTRAFLTGMDRVCKEKGNTRWQLDICDLNVEPCRGCFACWKATPGSCIIKDDMADVIDKLLWADLIVVSFPLYYFSVPGPLKNLIDRQLPMVLPFMEDRTDGVGSGSHDTRYDLRDKRWVLISTCGFYSAKGNYDSVRGMFDHICGKGNYETVFCGQGELFSVKELSERTDAYLRIVEKAGMEFASGGINAETKDELEELLYPKDVFEAMADASWGIDRNTGEKEDSSLIFTRQMAALYNKNSHDGRDRVLEICYTDLGKTYQILLGREGSEVHKDGRLNYTTRIETPWDVWLSVSRGEMRGDVALAKHLYQVSGDFSLMMNWNKYFGSPEADTDKVHGSKDSRPDRTEKPPVMMTMLAAWITFWVAVSIDPHTGSVVTLGVCGCLPVLMMRHDLCIYDKLSFAAVSVLSVFAFIIGSADMAVILGYLLFGLLWLGSCLTKEPLCAAYVKYGFGGDDALENPIFMRTNYIIAAAWGVLYICIAIWTFFLTGILSSAMLLIVNQIMPVMMGLFTVWFQKWYPEKMAGM